MGGTALLARTELTSRPLDAEVDRLEAEVKAAEDEMKEVKDDEQNGTSDESGTKGTALLARTELTSRPLEAQVADLKDKLEHVKRRKEDIDRYVPKEYQTDAVKAWKRKVDRLEAEVKAAEDEMKEVKDDKQNGTSDESGTKGTALLAR